jgi:hypothetical protein
MRIGAGRFKGSSLCEICNLRTFVLFVPLCSILRIMSPGQGFIYLWHAYPGRRCAVPWAILLSSFQDSGAVKCRKLPNEAILPSLPLFPSVQTSELRNEPMVQNPKAEDAKSERSPKPEARRRFYQTKPILGEPNNPSAKSVNPQLNKNYQTNPTSQEVK